jgi:hypothetical protein
LTSTGSERPQYKSLFGEPDAKAQDYFVNPDSRINKCLGGFWQCYNSQIAVDGDSRLVVATGVTQSASEGSWFR